MAGLTDTGVTIKRHREIVESIAESQREQIDADISNNDNEFLGQLNSIYASSAAELWEFGQAIYDAYNIRTSEGIHLENLAALLGIYRQEATPSSGMQYFRGRNGATFPSGYLVRNPSTRDTFYTLASLSLQANNAIKVRYSVNAVEVGSTYRLTVGDDVADYTAVSGDTTQSILEALLAIFEAFPNRNYIVGIEGNLIAFEAINHSERLNTNSNSRLSVEDVTSRVTVNSVETGFLVVPQNSVTQLVGIVVGAIETYNPEPFVTGREVETDEELRERVINYRVVGGLGTIDTIRAGLISLPGVISVGIFENKRLAPDERGRPGKSYEAVIVGGTDRAIADELWRTKPAGGNPYGMIEVNVRDSQGDEHTVGFTRPLPRVLAARITYTLYDEEQFPQLGEDSMADAVVNYINSLGPDVDVIPTRVFGPIYRSTPGIDSLKVEFQELEFSGEAPDPNLWSDSRIPIDYHEFATIFNQDIYFVEGL